jgi:hypothetical protein
MACIQVADFPDPGLYLLWPDGARLDLTRKAIEEHVEGMLKDPARIPPHVRAAVDYQPCDICPERDKAVICHAIMTALPFIDEIDRYMSYDKVVAVFRDRDAHMLHVTETTMQEALKYVVVMGLMNYCEVGRKYGRYFEGVNPLMSVSRFAAAVFRNIHFEHQGNAAAMGEIVRTMKQEILHTTKCQAKRLSLISQHDAFLNAFVEAYTTTQYIFLELMKYLNEDELP